MFFNLSLDEIPSFPLISNKNLFGNFQTQIVIVLLIHLKRAIKLYRNHIME